MGRYGCWDEKNVLFCGKILRNRKKRLYLQSQNTGNRPLGRRPAAGTDAEIAQLVERNLAKVEVAGPSPVFRSKAEGRIFKDSPFCFACRACRGDGLGTCDLKAPLPGAGGVCKVSRNRSRAARVRVPFSALRVRRKDEQRTDKIIENIVYQRYARLFLVFPHSC